MMHSLRIEQLGPEDMAAVAELEALCFSTPWKEEQLCAALSSPYFIVYGLKRQDRLLSYVSLGYTPGEIEILNLATHPETRRQGLARSLLSEVLEKAMGQMPLDEDGRAVLEVRESNVAARSLYESLGFSIEGRRKAYYQDTGEDALIMLCRLCRH